MSEHDNFSDVELETGSYQSGRTSKSKQSQEAPGIADAKLVRRSKGIVYLSLLIAAVTVSVLTYFFLQKEQEKALDAEFQALSREILKQAQGNCELMFKEIFNVGKVITSQALSAGMSWPNVTLPFFDVLAQNEASTFEFVGFAPFVKPETKDGWLAYSVQNQDWIQQAYNYTDGMGDYTPDPIPEMIHKYESTGEDIWFTSSRRLQTNYSDPAWMEYEVPLWQVSPAPADTSIINLDLVSHPVLAHLLWDVKEKKVDQYSRAIDVEFLMGEQANDGQPRSTVYQPVFEDFREDAEVVGFMLGVERWDFIFQDVLFESEAPVIVAVEGNCSNGFSYRIEQDGDVEFLGSGTDYYEQSLEKYKKSAGLLFPKNSRHGYPPVQHKHRPTDAAHNESHCTYVLNTYPTEEFEEIYINREPLVFSIIIAGIFAMTTLVFLSYDILVEQRQRRLVRRAKNTDAIVSSIFPKKVRERLLADADDSRKTKSMQSPNYRVKNYLDGPADDEEQAVVESKKDSDTPIADLFPHCTVFFADIAGFTAWSSSREPAQVFILLQGVYQAFDIIAKRRRVFKVETIGDSYVAVTGLPDPQRYHAVIMAKFAWECLRRFGEVAKELELTLGPETADLSMRFGLHSGPVTAGVLKGDRARFQLFGDTVNTAARMESTGARGRIQVSKTTADMLIKAGHAGWVTPRLDAVHAKGKGTMKTYWLALKKKSSQTGSTTDSMHETTDLVENGISSSSKEGRLVSWVTDLLLERIKTVVSVRQRCQTETMTNENLHFKSPDGKICLDEVKEAIEMPKFDANVTAAALDASEVEIPFAVSESLKDYVEMIAKSYRRLPFHNFEHACHVSMSVNKLICRVVTPDLNEYHEDPNEVAARIHNFTHGITSDPLAILALVFSALIHDVDHQGVSNLQLSKEEPEMGEHYHQKSIAEQNSLDVAWDILMSSEFDSLRKYIFGTRKELLRFRQLIVNIVLATDIFDKELGDLRKRRWDQAFRGEKGLPDSMVDDLRATIVMEHIIQASDVSHTMQHWNVYKKWNRQLFGEMYQAWKAGRMDTNPVTFWYKGELSFFDNYIIPLAKKLSECNVFGVSSDEYLSYAVSNRGEWEERGEEIVAEFISEVEQGAPLDCVDETSASTTSFASMGS